MVSKRTVTATFLGLGVAFLGLGLFTSDHVAAQNAGLVGVVLMLTGVVRSLRSVTKPQAQDAAPTAAPAEEMVTETDSDISLLALVVSSIDSDETMVAQDLNTAEANPLPVVSQKIAAKKTAKKPKANTKKTNTKSKKTPKKKKTGAKATKSNKNKKASTKKSRR